MNEYIIPASIAVTILLVAFAFFLILFVVIQKQKQNSNALRQQQLIFSYEKKLLNSKIEEQERVMTQISREVHDNFAQTLNHLLMNNKVTQDYAINTEQVELLQSSTNMLNELLVSTTNISHSLSSDFVKSRGLYDILKSELKSISASKSIQCEINLTGGERILNPDEELIVYRIAQEAIHNILKHAKAKKINIILHNYASKFSMKIIDDGIGFNKNKIFDLDGIGYLNMLQRSKFLNGNLNVESEPNKGCTVSLEILRNT
jgi:signal transduction histidine kinase